MVCISMHLLYMIQTKARDIITNNNWFGNVSLCTSLFCNEVRYDCNALNLGDGQSTFVLNTNPSFLDPPNYNGKSMFPGPMKNVERSHNYDIGYGAGYEKSFRSSNFDSLTRNRNSKCFFSTKDKYCPLLLGISPNRSFRTITKSHPQKYSKSYFLFTICLCFVDEDPVVE